MYIKRLPKFSLILLLMIVMKSYCSFFSYLPEHIDKLLVYKPVAPDLTTSPLKYVYLLEIKFEGFMNKKTCLATLIRNGSSFYLVTAKYCFSYKNNIVDVKKIKQITSMDSDGKQVRMQLGPNSQYKLTIINSSDLNHTDDGKIVIFTLKANDVTQYPQPLNGTDGFNINPINEIYLGTVQNFV